MDFESVKYFFENAQAIKFNTNEKIDASYLIIHNIYNNDRVSFSSAEINEIDKVYHAYVSENDAIKLKDCIESSTSYFAKIVEKADNFIYVSFVKFNKLPITEPLEIGVGDIDLSYEQLLLDLEENFILKVGLKKYYILGHNKNGNNKVFSIISPSSKYDVVLTRRELCGDCLEENAKDEIWAIKTNKSEYKKDDYLYEVRSFNYTVLDYSSVGAATIQSQTEINDGLKSVMLSRWEKFAQEDFAISIEKTKGIGQIRYTKVNKEDNGLTTFVIPDGNNTKLEALINYFRSQGETSLDVFASYRDKKGEYREKRVDSVSLVKLTYNSITCYYDGDKVFKDNCYLQVSNAGSKAVYERRIAAINRIKDKKAAKPNIMLLLEGISLHNKETKKIYKVDEFKKEIEAAFKDKKPNASQLSAIEMAINTPDFACIQGPPGCGKTSLINAIDNCLAKIDSAKHKYGASLSTAYQRESTKNMVLGKCINGVPVPFISRNSDRIYIEDNFISYIDDISKNLKEKYPEIVDSLNKQKASTVIADYLFRYSCDISIDTLSSSLKNLKILLGDSLNYSEIDKLDSYINLADKHLKKLLMPVNEDSLYYIRIIPSNKVSFEDDGFKTFVRAKAYLTIDDDMFADSLGLIEEELSKTSPNFDFIHEMKTSMILDVKNKKQLTKNLTLNNESREFLESVKYRIENTEKKDNDVVIRDFVDSFMNNPIRVRQALEQWITSVAATHQISGDARAVYQAPSLFQREVYAEYNNVLIDEAARSCPPDLLIPISCAKNKIIMVGDHKQLPQFMNDEVLGRIDEDDEIKVEMKNVSMFEYLIDTAKKLKENDSFERFVALDEQYRMPKILGDFIGENFYKELKLKSPLGNPDTNPNFIQTLPIISNKCMVWCDEPNGNETKVMGKGYWNIEEAQTISKMVKLFLADENNKKLSIGVISFYKDQIVKIKEYLQSGKDQVYVKDKDGIRIKDEYKNRIMLDTVDAFQGLEKDIIILSMVRSDTSNKFGKSGNPFGFMKDYRRLCVALSRQKKCLIVVGNGSGMLCTDYANKKVPALVNFYHQCENGGEFIGFIKSKDFN